MCSRGNTSVEVIGLNEVWFVDASLSLGCRFVRPSVRTLVPVTTTSSVSLRLVASFMCWVKGL